MDSSFISNKCQLCSSVLERERFLSFCNKEAKKLSRNLTSMLEENGKMDPSYWSLFAQGSSVSGKWVSSSLRSFLYPTVEVLVVHAGNSYCKPGPRRE